MDVTGSLLFLPRQFAYVIFDPWVAGVFSLIPNIGIASLGVGLILACFRRHKALLLAVGSVFMSQAWFVLAATILRGGFSCEGAQIPSLFFLLLQLMVLVSLVYFAKTSRAAAAALTIFCASYAFYAAFIGLMALCNTWL